MRKASPPNAGFSDAMIDGVFAVALAAVAWLSVFGHRGVAPCAGVMALAVAGRAGVWRGGVSLLTPRRFSEDPLSVALLAALLFSSWIAVGAFWSPTPGAEWLGLTVLAAILVGGALGHEAAAAGPRRAARHAAMFALAICAAVGALLFEGLSGGWLRAVVPPEDASPFRWKDMVALGRGVTAIAPLAFPAAAIIWRITGSFALALTPVFALMAAAAQFSVFANVVGLGAGVAVFAAASLRPRGVLRMIAGLYVIALATAPFAMSLIPVDALLDQGALAPASWTQRLVVWREASVMAIRECLPAGCGADYARAVHGAGRMIEVPGSPISVPLMPVHPHNLFLQIWLELGVPGVVFFAAASVAATMAILRAALDRRTSAAIAGVALFSFISVMIEMSIWQAWRLAIFALAAFGCAVSYSINKSQQ